MPKPRVFLTRLIAQEGMDLISRCGDMEVWPGDLPPPRDALIDKARASEGLLVLLTDKVDADLLDAVPKVKVVSNMAVGYDNIDIKEATRRGIVVGYTPGVLTETTADLAFALLTAAARRVVEGDQYTRKGMWKTWGPLVLVGRDIHGATLGIVGMGKIGAEMAKRGKGFGMQVLYHSRTRQPNLEGALGVQHVESLQRLLSVSDFVSLHVPLTDRTFHLIGPQEFATMKRSAVLVNTSRGSVVDQKALYEALKSGQIFAAGIDVTEVEPIPLDDPLLTLENVVITPHIGSASVATRTRMAIMAAENLIAGLEGRVPPNCVNPEAMRNISK